MKKIFAYGMAMLFIFTSASYAETAGKGPHLINGDKSYQNIGAAPQTDNTSGEQLQKTGDAQNVSQTEPAAGASTSDEKTAAPESKREEPLHEQMRAPRKGF